MNEWQMIQQLKFLTEIAVWPGSTNRAFPMVEISAGRDAELIQRNRFPLLVWRPGGAQSDPGKNEEPNLMRTNFLSRLYVHNEGDGVGESSIIGSHRPDKLQILGRGLLEVQERLVAAAGKLTGINGVKIINRFRSAVGVDLNEDRRQIAFREYVFEGMVGNDRTYSPSTRLSATPTGGGNVDLTWRNPSRLNSGATPGLVRRFDFVRMRLRRASGAAAPATSSAGTDVTLAAPTSDESVTDSGLTPGTFSYSMFAVYDDTKRVPTDENEDSPIDKVESVIVT